MTLGGLDYRTRRRYYSVNKLKLDIDRYVVPGWGSCAPADLAILAGKMHYQPMSVCEPTTYIRIGIDVKVAGIAGDLARLGVYEWDDGLPGNLILDAGTVAVDAIAGVEIVIDLTLDRGWYFAAFVSDGAPSLEGFASTSAIMAPVSAHSSNLTTEPGKTGLMRMGQAGQVAGGLADPAVVPNGSLSAANTHVRFREN